MNTVDILGELVSRTPADAMGWIYNYLKDLGVKQEFIKGRSGDSMLISIGDESKSGLILSGHLDVVPADGQSWDSDPYKLTLNDGKAFARGTCDMKGFVACVLSVLPKILSNKLSRPIFLALTYDEETSCESVGEIISFFKTKPVFPRQCIVGEPSEMLVCDRHKNCKDFKIIAKGKAAHASNPANGVNAIYPIIELCGELRRFFEKNKIIFNIGSINGGIVFNIVPEYCEVMVEYRSIEDWDRELFLIVDEFKSTRPDIELEVKIEASMPPLTPTKDGSLNDLCIKVLEGKKGEEYAACTEAGFYSAVDIETVICGPGSILQAHKPNEFITLEQLKMCEDFLIDLLHKLLL